MDNRKYNENKMDNRKYNENKMEKYILCIIFLTLAFIALVPIGSLVFAQSEDDEDEEQNDDSNNYYTTEVGGKTIRVYPDGRHVIEETGDCYYRNSEAENTYPCDEGPPGPEPGRSGHILSSPED